jgi:DNA-binding Xre family transcriptional regulator
MRTKSFKSYLEKRLSTAEIVEIEAQAELEALALKALQTDISNALSDYMQQENIGFNELVRRLGFSPIQVSKIQQGKANLTLTSLAHIFALLKKLPHIVSATPNAHFLPR